jgi:hypothetical protein
MRVQNFLVFALIAEARSTPSPNWQEPGGWRERQARSVKAKKPAASKAVHSMRGRNAVFICVEHRVMYVDAICSGIERPYCRLFGLLEAVKTRGKSVPGVL